jgi:hypothetical protein
MSCSMALRRRLASLLMATLLFAMSMPGSELRAVVPSAVVPRLFVPRSVTPRLAVFGEHLPSPSFQGGQNAAP